MKYIEPREPRAVYEAIEEAKRMRRDSRGEALTSSELTSSELQPAGTPFARPTIESED